MIAVLIAGLALGANDLRRRRDRFLSLRSLHESSGRAAVARAEMHAATAAGNEREARRLRTAIRSGDTARQLRADLIAEIASNIEAAAESARAAERKLRASARFHDALRAKYDRAARYPWIRVSPDPPEPE
jgi:hypothetical protein